jgi:DNA-binding NtrC family response regulator
MNTATMMMPDHAGAGFARAAELSRHAAAGQRPPVLVVDDDPGLPRLMELQLDAAGYRVIGVDSGEGAIARLAVSRPQVVVTDLQMGGMALFEAIRAENPALPESSC